MLCRSRPSPAPASRSSASAPPSTRSRCRTKGVEPPGVVTVSIGIAAMNKNDDAPWEGSIRRADLALYRAKAEAAETASAATRARSTRSRRDPPDERATERVRGSVDRGRCAGSRARALSSRRSFAQTLTP